MSVSSLSSPGLVRSLSSDTIANKEQPIPSQDIEESQSVWAPFQFVLGYVFQACLLFLSFLTYNYYEQLQVVAVDNAVRQIAYFKTCVMYLVSIITIRVLTTRYLFKHIGSRFLANVRGKYNSHEDWMLRVDRFAFCLFKLCYFVFIVSWGYRVLSDTDFLPPELGGKAGSSIANTFRPDPPSYRNELVLDEQLMAYYMCQLAYHSHSLMFQFYLSSRNDLLEMLLHHIVTIFLILFSFLSNYTKIGLIIGFIHDIADISSYAVKCFADSAYKKTTAVIFLSVLASWGYTRLYVFPFVTIKYLIVDCWHPKMNEVDISLIWFCIIMLVILQVLHCYWYGLFLYMGYRFVVTGSTKDVQSQIMAQKQQKKHQQQPKGWTST